jgi:hypothetical protein
MLDEPLSFYPFTFIHLPINHAGFAPSPQPRLFAVAGQCFVFFVFVYVANAQLAMH